MNAFAMAAFNNLSANDPASVWFAVVGILGTTAAYIVDKTEQL
jgi:hypothetical protein